MILTLENVSRHYRDAERDLPIINSLSYRFPDSGGVSIVGRSGVGKSTLLNLLGGLDLPTSGRIMHGAVDLATLNPSERARFRGANLGVIFQSHHLLAEFDALDNVIMPLRIQGEDLTAARKRASELLEQMGLGDRMQHRPSQLSGGEQQRVAIARAMATRPGLVLADEPTGNLDPGTANQISEMLAALSDLPNTLLVVVTHNLEFAASFKTRLEMLPGGQLVERTGQ